MAAYTDHLERRLATHVYVQRETVPPDLSEYSKARDTERTVYTVANFNQGRLDE